MIDRAINYAKQFLGVKYSFWINSMSPPTKDKAPFWIENKPPPSIEQIKKEGMCCVGLTNLMRRHMNLEVPGHITNEINNLDFIGGTENWFSYLKNQNRLKEIDYTEKVPVGTLLLQNYNDIDQGHVAVIIESSEEGLLESKKIHAIMHSSIELNDNEELINKYNQVVEEKFKDYLFYKRYTHICYPEDWLLKN
jgi:hypothetical protein